MDELLKAITGLINTGGALADDALYLYFGLKYIQTIATAFILATPVWIICRTVLEYQKHEKNEKKS